jgi:hypothetical protein
MKRILLALFILIATSSLAQVTVVGYVSTLGVANYPTHIDSMGKGGYVVVRDTTQRNAITCLRRKYGMAAYVQSLQKLYILKDSNCANTWVEFTAGSGGVSKITAGTNITISPIGGTGDVTINAEGGGFSQGLQSVIDISDSLNAYGFHFRTPSSSPYAVRLYGNPAAAGEPNLYMPKENGTIALEGNQNKAVTYTPIDLKNNGDYGVVGNSYYNIRVGSDIYDPVYPGFLLFPVATTYDGQRITIVNNDTVYKLPAYIAQSIYDVPLLEGTNEPVTCIPYGMTYEFVSMNGYWYATTLKQRETRTNLPIWIPDTDDAPYDLNNCNAIYQFTGFKDKYNIPKIGIINFPPASYVYGSDTIPINDGQRITIINDQGLYPIIIGENKPYKTGIDGFVVPSDYGVIDTIPPGITYEFVSVGGYWRLTTPIFIPEYFGVTVASADYKITTYGIYKFETNGNSVILPSNAKLHRGETIIIQNASVGGLAVKYEGGASFANMPSGQTITIVGIGDDYVITAAYP